MLVKNREGFNPSGNEKTLNKAEELKQLETKEKKEIGKVISGTKNELELLKTESTKSNNESNEFAPRIIKLDNNYTVKAEGSSFSIDVNDERYGITVKMVDTYGRVVSSGGRIVFEAKHEGYFTANDVVLELTNEEMTDDTNIDMINGYLKDHGLPLITNEKDINTLKQLFGKLNDKSE